MNDDGLAEAHAAGLCHAVEKLAVLAVDEFPRRVAKPCKSAAIVKTLGALVQPAATHMVTIDVAVGELVEQLVGKGRLGTKDDAVVLLRGHLAANEVDAAELRIIGDEARHGGVVNHDGSLQGYGVVIVHRLFRGITATAAQQQHCQHGKKEMEGLAHYAIVFKVLIIFPWSSHQQSGWDIPAAHADGAMP